jgi:predicted esterase
MKKLFTSLITLLVTLTSYAQSRQWFASTYGYGAFQAYIQVPENYNSRPSWNLVIFLHGAGERGTNPADMLGTGLAKYLNDGASLPALVICPQMDESAWDTGTKIETALNYMKTNYNVNVNKVYITGLSLGASGAVAYTQSNPSKIAAVLPVSGSYVSTSPRRDSSAKVPTWFVHGTHDNTQNASNAYNLLTAIQALDPVILPQGSFYWSGVHDNNIWNGKVYNIFEQWHQWLNLHDKNVDSTARNYVDSAEIGNDWNFYWRAHRLVSSLPSGSHKTNLQARLALVKDAVYGAGHQRVLCDMGNNLTTGNFNKIGNNTNGATYTNLVDETGANSGWKFTVVTKTAPTGAGTAKWGENRSYFAGAPDSVYGDAFRVAGAAGQLRFSDLDSTKTYNIYISGGTNTNSAFYTNGVNVAINGVTKTIVNQFRNTHHHIVFNNVSAAGGQITLSTSPHNNGINNVGDGAIGFIEIAEVGTGTGNQLPIANAGPNQTISADSTDLNGTASSDADGTITAYSWTQVSGPSTANINTPASSQPGIGGLVPGVYVFSLVVTDNNSAASTNSATVQITVTAPPADRLMKVNVYGGDNPYLSGNWNNWNVTASPGSSGLLNYDDGTASTASMAISHSEKVVDNGAAYGGVMAPPEVLRYTSYSTIIRTVTISGLDNGKLYDIELYGSRPNAGNSTRYVIGTDTVDINTHNNLTNAALFTGIAPVANQIVVRIHKLNTFNYLNGLVVTERSGESASSSTLMHAPAVQQESSAALTAKIVPNPVTGGQLRMKFESAKAAGVQLHIVNMGGQAVAAQQFSLPAGRSDKAVDVSQLKSGIYMVRIQQGARVLSLKFVKGE